MLSPTHFGPELAFEGLVVPLPWRLITSWAATDAKDVKKTVAIENFMVPTTEQ
jgi:hypothetical protein